MFLKKRGYTKQNILCFKKKENCTYDSIYAHMCITYIVYHASNLLFSTAHTELSFRSVNNESFKAHLDLKAQTYRHHSHRIKSWLVGCTVFPTFISTGLDRQRNSVLSFKDTGCTLKDNLRST